MAKLTLTDIFNTLAGSIISAFNNNNTAIENAIENTLSRDGTGPNEMNAQLDMNSNKIINLPAATTSTEPVRYAEFSPFITDLNAAVAAAQAAQVAAELAYDNFDDRYLGQKNTFPVVDNDGNALVTGAVIFYTGDNTFYVWNGSAWITAVTSGVGTFVRIVGDSMTGELNMQDNLVTRPIIKDYALRRTAPNPSAGVLTLDFTNGNIFEPPALSSDITSIVVNNWPPTGELGKLHFILKQDGTGGRAVSWPGGWRWPNNAPPTMTPTANKTDIFVIMSPDAGTTVYATTAGQNY